MTQSKPDIILYGGPAAGKSTQAKILVKKLAAAHMYMGGELRKLATDNSELGKKIKAVIDSGKLVDAKTAGKIADKFISEADPNQRIIFDGYPRIASQAKFFLEIMKKHNRNAVLVYIKLPIPVALERLSERAQSSDRVDDTNPKAIRKRVEIFQKEAEPLKDIFKDLKHYVKIDGSGTIAHVSKEILEAVK